MPPEAQVPALFLPPVAQESRRLAAAWFAKRLKRLPAEERRRTLSLKVSDKTFPYLYQGSPEHARQAWAGLLELQRQGLIDIEYSAKAQGTDEPYYHEPKIISMPSAFLPLAQIGGVAVDGGYWESFAAEPQVFELLGTEVLGWVVEHPLPALEDYAPEQAARRLVQLRILAHSDLNLYLREASARVFEGRSKVLDGRLEWVSGLLGCPCPWKETPVSLQVAVLGEAVSELVFVENLTTFESLRKRQQAFPGVVFLYSAGYKAAAARAPAGGASLYFDEVPHRHASAAISAALTRIPGGAKLLFYGDLDYSGMDILGALRRAYPGLEAWRPGYEALAKLLLEGKGHAPDAADKTGQKDPGATGCLYADEVLLPALRRSGQFIDQEAVIWSELPKLV